MLVIGIAVVAAGSPAAAATTGTRAPVRTGQARGLVPHRAAKSAFPTFQLSPDIPLDYLGGPVLRTNETFAVFWDPQGRLSQPYRDLVVRYLRDVAHDGGKPNVYSVLEQYSDGTGPIANASTFAGSLTDAHPYPRGCPTSPGFSECMTDAQVATELDEFLFAHGVARPPNRTFLVFTPSGVDTCIFASGGVCRSNFFCAYHSTLTGGHGDAIYANLPYAADPACDTGEHPNGNDADPVLNDLSHEHREMINDPLVHAGTSPGPAAPAWIDGTGFEGSDKCVNTYGPTRSSGAGNYNQVINGHPYLLQMEWSNKLAQAQGFGCVLDGVDRAPLPAFTTQVSGARAAFDARSTSDPDPGDSTIAYVWRYGDGFVGFGSATQAHRYRAAGTYTVELQTVDTHGATAVTQHSVRVDNPRAKATGPFTADLTEALDDRGPGRGTGKGTRIGAFTSSTNLFWDFSDAPAAYHITGGGDFENKRGDLLGFSYELTLTDVANPPGGRSFNLAGTYVFEGGFGVFYNATGDGAITGHCTSSPDSDVATCTSHWDGTIGSG
jgi:PKD domain